MRIASLKESSLIRLADEGRRVTSWWLSYVVAVGVGLFVVFTLAGSLLLNLAPAGSFAAQWLEAAAFAIQALWIILWVRLFEGRGFTSLGFRGRGGLAKFGIGLAIGAAMNLTVSAILVLLGGYTFTASAPDPGLGVPVILLVVATIVTVTVQATTEEIYFRGFLLQSNAHSLPGIVALLLPPVVFAALHMTEGFEPIAAINIILFAVAAALIALRQGSLFLVAGIHTGWNWFMGNVIGAPVSGIDPKDVTLFTLSPNSGQPSLLTGGNFGPENTIATTVVWAIVIAVAYRYFRAGQTSAGRTLEPVDNTV